MGRRHRNGALQMGVGRHQRRLQAVRLVDDGALQSSQRGVEPSGRVHGPKSRCRRDLIVPAPTRMQLRCDVTDLVVQEAVDQGVNILIGRPRLRTGLEARGHGVQSALDRPALLECQHRGVIQGHRPGFRQLNVVGPKAKIDVDGVVQRFELRRGRAGESATPQLVRLTRGTHEGRRHAI